MQDSHKPRPLLSVRFREIEILVANAGEGTNLDEVRAFALKLWRDRNDWSVQRGGSLVNCRISRRDADRELRRALATLNDGGGAK